MSYARKIVLLCPEGATPGLDALVEDLIRQGVRFIAVVGKDCSHVEDLIDELVVGEGSHDRFILTSSHPDQDLDQAIAFAKSLTGDYADDDIQVIKLPP